MNVGCPADDAEMAGGPRIDLAKIQAVGIRMALDRQNLGDVDIGERRRMLLDVLNFDPRHREPTARSLQGRRRRDEFA